MKNNKLTDRIIRNKLKHHASPNPDHLWEAIEAELPKDNKNRGGFWWFTGGMLGLALLLSAAAFFWLGESNKVTSLTASNSDAIVSNNRNASQNEKTETTINESKVTAEKVAAAVVSNTDVDQSNLAVAKTNNLTTTDRKVLKENNNKITSTKLTTSVRENKITENLFTNKKAADFNNKAFALEAAVTKGSPLTMSEETEEIETLAATSKTNHFAPLDLSSREMLLLNFEEKEINWPSLFKDPKCATFSKWLKLQFYVDAYISPDVAFRKLESKATDFERYAADRRATESQLLSFSSGIRFSVISNFGLSARTGIVYSQINEKFDYQEELT